MLYAAAFVLVLLAAGVLLLGIVRDEGGTIALSVVGSAAALILLWVGVTRSSRPSQRHHDR